MGLTFISNIKATTSEWPEDRKSTKESVNYTNYSKTSDQCMICANVVPPERCKTVRGPIALTGWCERFKPAK